MPGPNLSSVPLEDCCLRVLRQMRGEYERAGLLGQVLAIAPLARAMEMRPSAIARAGVRLVISMTTGEWNQLREIADMHAFAIARARCGSWAASERSAHGGFNPVCVGQLCQFWEGMMAVYS